VTGTPRGLGRSGDEITFCRGAFDPMLLRRTSGIVLSISFFHSTHASETTRHTHVESKTEKRRHVDEYFSESKINRVSPGLSRAKMKK
jgi:hypothetical protein